MQAMVLQAPFLLHFNVFLTIVNIFGNVIYYGTPWGGSDKYMYDIYHPSVIYAPTPPPANEIIAIYGEI